MQHKIEFGPSFAWLRVQLGPGEAIDAEAGAMVTRTPELGMSTRLNAGRRAGLWRTFLAFFVALARKIFGGETVFINTFSGDQGGEVVLAPSLSGQIMHRPLSNNDVPILVQAGSYLASTEQVDTKLRWAGLRGFLSGEGIVFLECGGQGDLFLNAYGGVHELQVDGTYVVDTGHLVAFDSTLDFEIRTPGGWKSLFLSGEGLVCEFRGRGCLWIQSRNVGGLVGWITPYLR